jgi:hypothetical protein
MQKTAPIIAGSTVAVVCTGFLVYRNFVSQICERFPTYDRKIVGQAYRKMMWKSLTGKYESADLTTDHDVDLIFVREVEALLDL